MKRPTLIKGARLVTPQAPGARRGADLGGLTILPRANVLIREGKIARIATRTTADMRDAHVHEANGRVLMPGFIDCHTHACWAGDRLDEWDMRRAGAKYLGILRAGGGIMSTVRAVRAASRHELELALRRRLDEFRWNGTTTIEVKSGYGLSTPHELKMLRAITAVAADVDWFGTVIATALLGHAIDTEDRGFVERTIRETLPAVHAEFPGIAVDAYCEQGAWSVRDTVRLLGAAKALGHPVRVHADQFNSLGMVPAAVRLGARSVDHLEATTRPHLRRLAASGTIGVMLPICGMQMDGRYMDGRRFIDAGGALAIATNCNPGSALCTSMPTAIAAAVRHGGLTPAEAIAAATGNAAAVLGLSDRGVIAVGMRADLVLLRHTDERALAYEVGGNPIDMVMTNGELRAGGTGQAFLA